MDEREVEPFDHLELVPLDEELNDLGGMVKVVTPLDRR